MLLGFGTAAAICCTNAAVYGLGGAETHAQALLSSAALLVTAGVVAACAVAPWEASLQERTSAAIGALLITGLAAGVWWGTVCLDHEVLRSLCCTS